MIINPTIVPLERKEETISNLIMRCNRAMDKMSNRNPHKALIYDCACAMRQLCDKLWALEHPDSVPVAAPKRTDN